MAQNQPTPNTALVSSSRSDRERVREALATHFGDSNTEQFPGSRRPIPVSTIEWTSTNLSQIIPMHGLDFLAGVEQVYIQQTVELTDLLSNQDSENLYTVKVPQGETLFLASESSTSCHRMCFGSNRAFSLRFFDHSRQEALQFRRRLACNFCLFGFYLQELEVWAPPGEFLGVVKQDWTWFAPSFSIINDVGNVLYHIEGPNMCVCAMYTEADFKVLSSDRMTQLGNISHQWDQILVGYNLSITFPARTMSVKQKALILGGAFLLEYMFFEQAKGSKICRCC